MLLLRKAALAILVLCTIGIGPAPAAQRGLERVLIGVSSKSIVRVSAAGVQAVLESEGAANVSWEQVADPSLVDEVLNKK